MKTDYAVLLNALANTHPEHHGPDADITIRSGPDVVIFHFEHGHLVRIRFPQQDNRLLTVRLPEENKHA